MDQTLLDLFHQHVAMAYDRQLRMADFLKRKADGEDWEYDTETATLNFGPKVRFEAPVIGSHADHNNSWLWAWSNRNLKLTLTNRALGDTVRMLVHRLGVHALGAHGFALEPLLGDDLTEHAAHVLGVILGGELGYDAYHIAPYEGGRALILVRDDRLHFTERNPLLRVLLVFPQVLSEMPVLDHKAALSGYAHAYGLTVNEQSGGLTIAGPGVGTLTATFNDHGYLMQLEGSNLPVVKKSPTPKKKLAAKPKKKLTRKPAPAVKKFVKKPAEKATKKKPAPTAKKKAIVAAKKKAVRPKPKARAKKR